MVAPTIPLQWVEKHFLNEDGVDTIVRTLQWYDGTNWNDVPTVQE